MIKRNVIAGNDQLKGMYQAIKLKQFQIEGEIDKMRVVVTGLQGNRQGQVVVQVQDGYLRHAKLVELYSEKVLGETVKERQFKVNQIEIIESPKFSKHFFVVKNYSQKESVITQGYFNGVDWCFENVELGGNPVSRIKVVIPKEF